MQQSCVAMKWVDHGITPDPMLHSLFEHGLMVIGGAVKYRHSAGIALRTAVIRIEGIVDLEPQP